MMMMNLACRFAQCHVVLPKLDVSQLAVRPSQSVGSLPILVGSLPVQSQASDFNENSGKIEIQSSELIHEK